ncbi:hypothetical protein Tco_0105848 [Tanacetum coccineum]
MVETSVKKGSNDGPSCIMNIEGDGILRRWMEEFVGCPEREVLLQRKERSMAVAKVATKPDPISLGGAYPMKK